MRASRARVISTVLVLISLPALLALAEAVSFYTRNASNGSLVSSGRKREYLLYVPRSYHRHEPTPLIISMHAAALWPAAQMETSEWNQAADQYGFIVVYPSALHAGPRVWHVDRSPGRSADVRFIAALIDTLQTHYNIDATRIYANGLSNGGGMAFVLSCELSQRIAAVGMVASAQTLPFSWCPSQKPVPLMVFHGTADPVVPYRGGSTWVLPHGEFPDMRAWVAHWARRNRCPPNPVDSAVAADVTRRAYTGCADNASVVLYTIQGGGHSWPGGKPLPQWLVGRTSNSIDATRVMWAFFREHSLPK